MPNNQRQSDSQRYAPFVLLAGAQTLTQNALHAGCACAGRYALGEIMKIFLAALLIMLPFSSYADNKDYEYCLIWGVAGGAEDQFIQNLVDKVLEKNGISQFDKVCSTLKQTAYAHGRQFSQGNTTNAEAQESWALYQKFRDK